MKTTYDAWADLDRAGRRLGRATKDAAVDAAITVGLVALCIRHLIFGGDDD